MKKSLNNGMGFTLIELMIVLVIIAVTILMAAPSFNTFLANRQIRNVAESIHSGMLVARANAIKSGHLTMFILDTTQGAWKVSELENNASSTTGFTVMTPDIDSFNWKTDYQKVQVQATAPLSAVTFDSFGKIRVTNPAVVTGVASAPISTVDVSPVATGDNIYALRVEAFLANGRGVRLCAPHLPATDPKTCSPGP